MSVTLPNARTVTEVFTLGRFGEVVLTSGAPLFSPTNGNVPGTPEEIDVANDANRILLDDARSGSNLYPGAYDVGDDPTALPRVGDQVAADDVVTGVLTFDFGLYRVQPVGAFVDFVTGTPRPAAPDEVGGEVTVASFNVLNYFTTLNDAGWAGEHDTPRGATSPRSSPGSRPRSSRASSASTPTSSGSSRSRTTARPMTRGSAPTPWLPLVGGSMPPCPPAPHAYVAIEDPDVTASNFLGGTFGTDAIKVAIIYRPSVVTPQGAPVSDPADRPGGPGVPGRVAVRPAAAGPDVRPRRRHGRAVRADRQPPQVQGQPQHQLRPGRGRPAGQLQRPAHPAGPGRARPDRRRRARERGRARRPQRLHARGPDRRVRGAGFTSPVDTFLPPEDRYSFVFEGERGELDHALVDGDLAPLVTGADIWHINSIEPPAKDYTSFNNPALFEPNAFRSSDHDPLLVGPRPDARPALSHLPRASSPPSSGPMPATC